jgi:DNA-binding XRE family transcriptional regulator
MVTKALVSPIGSTADEAARRRAARSPEYRRAQEAKSGYREVAWLLIKYRMDHGLTQEELAHRVGTSYSQISRIESGRQRTSLETLLRIAHALDLKMVVGFEEAGGDTAGQRQLVAI